MKKTLTVLSLVLLVCVASVFALTACGLDNIQIESEGTIDVTADTKADCIELIDGFFEETLTNPNVVVTIKEGETVYLTETIVGANDCLAYSNGSNAYAIKDGDKYLVLHTGEQNNYVFESKEYYDVYYCTFLKSYVTGVLKNEDPEEGPVLSEESGTFTAANHVEEKNGKTNGTLACTYTSNDGNTVYTINATEKDGLVQKIDLSATMEGATESLTITFSYGSAVINVPDYKSWASADEDEEEIDDEDDENLFADFDELESGDAISAGKLIAYWPENDDKTLAVLIDNTLVATLAAGETYELEADVTVIGADRDAPALYLTASAAEENND